MHGSLVGIAKGVWNGKLHARSHLASIRAHRHDCNVLLAVVGISLQAAVLMMIMIQWRGVHGSQSLLHGGSACA